MAEIKDKDKDKVVTVESLGVLHDYNKKVYMSNTDPVGSGSLSLNRKEDTIIGLCSVTAGSKCEASGDYSYAGGFKTISTGYGSNSDGVNTIATAYACHVEGDGTIASGDTQHVQGRYNVEDTNNKFAHIVGNGDSDDERSNAHTIDWNGNAWFSGNIEAEGNIILSSNQYGDALPAAGTKGRIFFKKLSE